MPGALPKLEGRIPSTQEIVDDCGRLKELGVTYLMTSVPGATIDERIAALEQYAADVLPEDARL
ncbi:hypothetical protein [Blastococcus sp. URHD0036]|uniref:hypothetical protein n=1 Tax=Blastococcus sp. URHD0036 TaxID=1380356 RepID=UPI000497BA32|nr:hypothetical protein [Blastococcus sp. URHD0036]